MRSAWSTEPSSRDLIERNAKLSVLIVDDDDDFRLLLRDILMTDLAGFAVETAMASSRADALPRIMAGGHDVLVLDYRLGADDGLDLLADIRAQGIRTPVLMLTGWSDEAVVLRAMKAGATDYLSKSRLGGGALGASVRYCVAMDRREQLHRRAQDEIVASEQRFRAVFDEAPIGMMLLDEDGAVLRANAAFLTMLGYEDNDVVGRTPWSFSHPDDIERAEVQALQHVTDETDETDETSSSATETRYLTRDGTVVWARLSARSLRGPHGDRHLRIAMIENVTDRRRADEARARLVAVVESSEDAIISTDRDGKIETWNQGAEKLFKYSSAEVRGWPVTFLVPPERLHEERSILGRAARGEAIPSYDTQRQRKDGQMLDVAVTMSPMKNPHGEVIGAASITRDLTPRRQSEEALRRSEEQFRQAQKMEAVGRLAGGVAHDFNNVLSVILSYSELALAGLRSGDPLRVDLEEIHSAGQRASDLTRQLLAFSRQQVLQPRVLDLNEVVRGMRSMLGRLLGEDVELVANIEGTIGRVLADPGQIEQVVMNLAVNARDAMLDGGTLTIATSDVTLAPELAASKSRPAGPYALLSITDTGVGMDDSTRTRIFEPFFTTKPKGKGTGLGLATVFGIVEQTGGFIDVTSAPGEGSTFRVYLPHTERLADTPLSTGTRKKIALGSETILLVEDEDPVRTVVCAILRRYGYTVLETANGGEAIMVATDYAGTIDLLLTDVVMPRMNGRALADQLARFRPNMRVLYASGYTDDAIMHHRVLEAGVPFIHKPFTPDSLLRKVREVLDQDGRIRAAEIR